MSVGNMQWFCENKIDFLVSSIIFVRRKGMMR